MTPLQGETFFFLRGRGWEQSTFVFHYSTFTPHEKSFYSLKSIIKLFFIYWYCLLLYSFHCVSIVSANLKAITAFNKLVRYYVILQSTASKCDWLKHESEATQKSIVRQWKESAALKIDENCLKLQLYLLTRTLSMQGSPIQIKIIVSQDLLKTSL